MEGPKIPTEEEVIGYLSSLTNWGRWGPEDQRGTLNLITPEAVNATVRLVRSGIRIPLGRTISPRRDSQELHAPLHFMIQSGEAAPPKGSGGATDWIGIAFHGLTITHLDAPSHMFWDGRLYNGFEARRVSGLRGAQVGSVEAAAEGAVARGVLADVPRFRGVRRLSGPDGITSDELAACLASEGIEPRSGDVLVVRTGRDVPCGPDDPPDTVSSHPGVHVECAPWLHRCGFSMLVADVAQEVQPSGYVSLGYPVHIVTMVAMGMWLVDNALLEELAKTCAERARWEFMFVLSPLRLKNATGSPVNPIAVF